LQWRTSRNFGSIAIGPGPGAQTERWERHYRLKWACVLSWQHRITRIRERCTDLFGRDGWRWWVIRTSNAYVFRDPGSGRPQCRAEHGRQGTCVGAGAEGTRRQMNGTDGLIVEDALGNIR
jgi:hypothetical protein